jgi:hypothetical protein
VQAALSAGGGKMEEVTQSSSIQLRVASYLTLSHTLWLHNGTTQTTHIIAGKLSESGAQQGLSIAHLHKVVVTL